MAKGLCFEYQTGNCHGACMGTECASAYNNRVDRAISSFQGKGGSVAIIGRGRNIEEQSLVLVERGTYVGYGFFEKSNTISDFETAKLFVKRSPETPTVQSLINGYVTNPRGGQVVVFDSVADC